MSYKAIPTAELLKLRRKLRQASIRADQRGDDARFAQLARWHQEVQSVLDIRGIN